MKMEVPCYLVVIFMFCMFEKPVFSDSKVARAIQSKEVGCYTDTTDRFLTGNHTRDRWLTQSKCFEFCMEGGYKYAGVEYYTWCFCGNELGTYPKMPFEDCAGECGGNTNENCGKHSRILVFEVAVSIQFEKVGCYEDRLDRFLTGEFMIDRWLTRSKCFYFCSEKGYKYAGVEYYTYCYCGNELGTYPKKPNKECRVAECGGDASQYCGDHSRIFVFKHVEAK